MKKFLIFILSLFMISVLIHVLGAVLGGLAVVAKGFFALILFLLKGVLFLGIVALIGYGIYRLINCKNGTVIENDMTVNSDDKEQEEESITKRCCPNCGTVLKDNMKFCISCGQPIETEVK